MTANPPDLVDVVPRGSRRWALASGLLLALALAACGGGAAGSGTADTAGAGASEEMPSGAADAPTTAGAETEGDAEAASEAGTEGGGEPITFAVAGPLTGDNAIYGTNLERGVQLAVDELNEAGGIGGRPVEIEVFDDRCDPTEAASVAQRIASGEFFGVIGHVCSSSTLAGLPIYDRAGLTVVSGSSTAPNVTQEGYANFSRTIPNDSSQGVAAAQLAIELLGHERVAIVYASDDYGQGLYEEANAAIAELGGTVAGAETYTPAETQDFTPQLTALAAEEPEALVMLGYFNDMGTMVGQLDRAGLAEVTLIGAAGVAQPDYVELGGEATEGTYLLSYYDPASPLPANEEFVQRFEEAYGEPPNEQAAFGYEVPFIYAQAIEAGATEQDAAEFVRDVTYEGPTGSTAFDENGDVVGKSGVVLVVQDGELVLDEELTTQLNEAAE